MKLGFLIRSVRMSDLDSLFQLSKMVYFINLPEDLHVIKKKIQMSLDSFAERIEEPSKREYIFVLEDLDQKKVIGTSMVIAQHGTPECPHMYFQLAERKHYSETIHQGFIHKVLKLNFDHDGPSEIGGLVIDPAFRGHEGKLGQTLSFARFQFIAHKRSWFKKEILSELMPPMTPDGESLLWEALGRRFTNLSYDEADVISRKNKEFITSLFPSGDIYTCLLDGPVRDTIGKVGKDTEPVRHLLEKIGFEWRQQIDPFDGGPHFWAQTDKISLVKNTKNRTCGKSVTSKEVSKEGQWCLVGNEVENEFRCIRTKVILSKDKVSLTTKAMDALEVEKSSPLVVTPV